MLDLGRPAREVGGLPLGLDDREPLHFHILPAPPRVRLDDNGLPRVTLLRKLDEGVLVGGLLELELDVGWPDELVEEARLQLVAETGEEEIVLSPVPVVGASAEVFLATRAVPEEEGLEASLAAALAEGDSSSTEDEAPPRFFSTLTTSVPQLNAPHATRFSASLSPAGVRLVEAALASRAAPLGALIRLQVEGLRPGREVLVHVNWARVYEHFSQHHRAGALLYVSEVRQLVETLREQSSIEIVAIEGPRAEGSEDSGGGLDEILQWVQDVLIARFMEPALPLSREPATASLGTTGELLGVGSAYAVKALTQVEEAHATLDFQRPRAVVRTFTAQAHLKDLLPGSSADEHIADGGLQHRWFQIMNFALRPARPLEVDHVREVAGTWAWGNEREALQLTPATAEARADAYMDESPDGRWALDLQITLSDDSPADPGTSHHVGPLHGDSRTLTVDLPRLLGLHRVEVIAPSIEDLISVRVQLRHLRGDAEQDKRVLDLSPGELRIATWFTDFQAGDRVEASPTWFLLPARILPGDTESVTTSVHPLAAPATWHTVQVWSAQDFGELSSLIAVLRSSPQSPAVALHFDGPGQQRAARLELHETGSKDFTYQVTKTWSDGRVEEDPWIPSDRPVLQVGPWPATSLEVTVRAVGPELPMAGVRILEIDLEYIDATNRLRHETTEFIEALADVIVWRAEILNPALRSYTYRVTTHGVDGSVRVGPRTETSDRLLLLPIQ